VLFEDSGTGSFVRYPMGFQREKVLRRGPGSGGFRRGWEEAQIVSRLVGIIDRFLHENRIGLAIRCPYIHCVYPVEILLIEASPPDAQLLLRLRLEMFGHDFPGKQGVPRHILGHVEDAPEHERQQRPAAEDRDGDVAAGGAFYDEWLVGG
jgi:hypothetical protein